MTNLKTELEEIDWSYGRTAKRTGYNAKHIERVANGKLPASQNLMQKLKDALIREGNKLLRLAEKL